MIPIVDNLKLHLLINLCQYAVPIMCVSDIRCLSLLFLAHFCVGELCCVFSFYSRLEGLYCVGTCIFLLAVMFDK